MRIVSYGRTACAALVVAITVAGGPGMAQTPATAPIATNFVAFPIAVSAGTYDLYAVVVDFPPGSATLRHVHGGPVVVTVITGELVLQRATGGERVLKSGDSIIENPGDVHALLNRSGASARIAASELIPKCAAETTVVK
jgi:quercetin dioxygenase-like cupin family protein